MVEQNKSPPAKKKESWVDDPEKALRIQYSLAAGIVVAGLVSGHFWKAHDRHQEQEAIQFFLQHNQQSETVTKDDLRSFQTQLETELDEIKTMISENAQRPKQRVVLKRNDKSPP